MVVGLIAIAAIAIGIKVDIDRELIDSSGLLKPSLLGWQLLYILPVAILTNDFFLVSLSLTDLLVKANCAIVELLATNLCLQDG